MGRRRRSGILAKFSKKQIADALRKSGGRIATACKYLEEAYGRSLHRNAIYQMMERHPDLREIRDWAQERIVDIAEHNMWEAVRKKDLKASRYILSSLGRSRGYGVQRHEHSGPDGGPITSQAEPNVEQIEKMSDEQLDDYFQRHAAYRKT